MFAGLVPLSLLCIRSDVVVFLVIIGMTIYLFFPSASSSSSSFVLDLRLFDDDETEREKAREEHNQPPTRR
jgi:hypothetical protein